jgi:TPR repeat protein
MAQLQVGNAYAVGLGVKQDQTQAIVWWRKAADQGLSYAQDSLGNAYHTGKGVSKDFNQAFIFFEKSAQQGDPSEKTT